MKALALVLATGALLAGGVTTAQAAEPVTAQDISTTIDPHSNIRSGPTTKSRLVYTTKTLEPTTIWCYAMGEWITDGVTSTAVWYGNIDGYVWGGNVNTTQDPPPGLRTCRD
ncbi:MAG TPA: hypothetical protein VF821_14255 [Lentzea sp.]